LEWTVGSEVENFSGKEPEEKSDGLWSLVVTWNGNIDVLEWRVRVTKSNDWNVHVGGLLDSLVITSWVSNNDESWLLELLGVLIGKSTWGPLSTTIVSTGVISELEDSSLSKDSV